MVGLKQTIAKPSLREELEIIKSEDKGGWVQVGEVRWVEVTYTEDKKQLDEHGSKRQDSSHQDPLGEQAHIYICIYAGVYFFFLFSQRRINNQFSTLRP